MTLQVQTSDNFTGTRADLNGTSLDLGGGGSAATWNADAGGLSVGSGVVTAGGGAYVAIVSGPSAVAAQRATLKFVSGVNEGVIVRAQDKANFMLLYADGAGDVKAYKCVSGGFTALTASLGTAAANDVFAFDVDAAGNYAAYQNGSSVGTFSDATYATGVMGFRLFSSAVADNFLAQIPASASGGGSSSFEPSSLAPSSAVESSFEDSAE